MKKSSQCPKCGSTDLLADVTVLDRGDGNGGERGLAVATFADPHAVIFKGKRESQVTAWVCAACGYLELYAATPAALIIPKA